MPRSRHQVAQKKFRVVTVTTKPITGESTKQAVTPLRRECRMMRRTCGDYACVLFYLHTRLRMRRAPGIPCALLIEGFCKARAHRVPRDGAVAPFAERGAFSLPAADPPARHQKHDAGRASHNAVLGVNAHHTGLMAGHEARQLIGRHQEINRGDDEQDNAEKRENKFHGIILKQWSGSARLDSLSGANLQTREKDFSWLRSSTILRSIATDLWSKVISPRPTTGYQTASSPSSTPKFLRNSAAKAPARRW